MFKTVSDRSAHIKEMVIQITGNGTTNDLFNSIEQQSFKLPKSSSNCNLHSKMIWTANENGTKN